jgi:hypothetical protein
LISTFAHLPPQGEDKVQPYKAAAYVTYRDLICNRFTYRRACVFSAELAVPFV